MIGSTTQRAENGENIDVYSIMTLYTQQKQIDACH